MNSSKGKNRKDQFSALTRDYKQRRYGGELREALSTPSLFHGHAWTTNKMGSDSISFQEPFMNLGPMTSSWKSKRKKVVKGTDMTWEHMTTTFAFCSVGSVIHACLVSFSILLIPNIPKSKSGLYYYRWIIITCDDKFSHDTFSFSLWVNNLVPFISLLLLKKMEFRGCMCKIFVS